MFYQFPTAFPSRFACRRGCLVAVLLMLTGPFALTSCRLRSPQAIRDRISETRQLPSQPGKEQPDGPLNGQLNSAQGSALNRKVTFRQADGSPKFSLQLKPAGGKLMDASGQVLVNLIRQPDGSIQITDANNATLGHVMRQGESWVIESPKRSKTLFTFRLEDNGDAALLRSDGSPLYQLKITSDGYVVAAEKEPGSRPADNGSPPVMVDRYQVSAHKGLGQLQSESGQVLLTTDNALDALALASFGFGRLSEAQQAGLAYALSAEGP